MGLHRSKKHHYIPQFYLDQWRDIKTEDLWVYQRDAKGNLRFDRRYPKSVGFGTDLYTIRPYGFVDIKEPSDEIERQFFQRIDDNGCRVHKLLLTRGISALNEHDRRDWATFVNAMIWRNKEVIEEMNAGVFEEHDLWKAALLKGRDEPSKARFEGLLNNLDVRALVSNAVLSVAIERIKDPEAIEELLKMEWLLIRVPGENHFLTCDRPVILNGPSGGTPIYLLSFPLSPLCLMVMHVHTAEFDHPFLRRLSVIQNAFAIEQATKYVFSSKRLVDEKYIKYDKMIRAFMKG